MILGIDLGSRADHTALVWLDGWNVVRAERWPLGVEYRDIIEQLLPLIEKADCVGVDGTGLGDPIVSLLREKRPGIFSVRFTGGMRARRDGHDWYTSKSILTNGVYQAMARGKLKVTCPEPGREQLRCEMLNFSQKAAKHGRSKYEAGQGHDDLVAALSIAVFLRLTHKLEAV